MVQIFKGDLKMRKHVAEPIKCKKDIQAVERYLKEYNYEIMLFGF